MSTIARQSVLITVLSAVGLALGFVNMALLFPRYLSPGEFGLTRLVVSISVLAAQVAQLGLESTVIRYFPYFRGKSARHGGLFSLALLVALAGAVAAMVVLAVLHPWFTKWFSDSSGLYGEFGLIVLPMTLAEVYFILLRGFSRSVDRSIAPVFTREFLLRVLQTALIGAHILWKLPFAVFIWGYAATFMLTTVLLLFDLWRSGGIGFLRTAIRLPRRMARSMARYSLFTMITGIAGIAAGNVDQLMLAAMLRDGLTYVAYYAVAMFMASIIMVPGRAMVMPALPIMAEAWRKRDMERIRSIYRRSSRVQLLLGIYVLLCIASCVDPLFTFLRPEYAMGKPVLLILGLTNVVALSSGLSGGIISTSRSYAFDAVTGGVHFALNLVLDFFFIKWLGALGAAWSSLGAMIVVVAWRVLFLGLRFGLWPFELGGLLRLAAPAGLCALVWLMPSSGHPALDILLRCVSITLLFWPLAHKLGAAPEITERSGAIRKHAAW
jgi:O-antigen/teichoic acid export membrane protein